MRSRVSASEHGFWLRAAACRWFMGMVQAFGVGPAWKQPDATHVVVYKQAETKTKELVGRVACRLSAENYGASEWWLLLEPQM